MMHRELVVGMPSYVPSCILEAQTYENITIQCLRTSNFDHLIVMKFLAQLMKPHLSFRFVPLHQTENETELDAMINSETNTIDMHFDIWDITAHRVERVPFTMPLLYYRYSFIVPAYSFFHESLLMLLPFDLLTVLLISVSVLSGIVLDAQHSYIRAPQRPFFLHLFSVFQEFLNVSGSEAQNLLEYLKWPKNITHTIYYGVLISAYCSFITNSLVQKPYPPFKELDELVQKCRSKSMQLVINSGSSFIEHLVQMNYSDLVGKATILPAYDTHKNVRQIIDANNGAFPSDNVFGNVFIGAHCDRFRNIVLQEMLERGYGLVLNPHSSDRHEIIELFNRNIAMFQDALQKIGESIIVAPCVQIDELYSKQLTLGHFQKVFFAYAVLLCIIGIFSFGYEMCWFTWRVRTT